VLTLKIERIKRETKVSYENTYDRSIHVCPTAQVNPDDESSYRKWNITTRVREIFHLNRISLFRQVLLKLRCDGLISRFSVSLHLTVRE